MSKKPSLDEFRAHAKANPLCKSGKPCAMCALAPELRAVVEAAWREGFRGTQVSGYLKSKGVMFTRNQVNHHFQDGHHEQA